MSHTPPRRRTAIRRSPGLVVMGLVVVGVIAGVVAWSSGAFDDTTGGGPDDGRSPAPPGAPLAVPLGAPIDAVDAVSWPRDDAGQPRAATAIEEPRDVEVSAADRLVLATPSQTVLLHQRDGHVTAVELQPQAEAGSAADAIAVLRRLLDDHDLLDAPTEQELADWLASDPDPDPLLGDRPSLQVSRAGAWVFAQLRPTAAGDWFVIVEVSLVPDDGASATP